MSAFEHWLAPMYEEELELDYDPDEVSALAARRDTQWNKLQGTDFLTINEKRHAIGYGPIEGGDVLDTGNKKPSSGDANDSDDDAPDTGSTGGFGPGIFGLPKKPSGLTPAADAEEEQRSIDEEIDPLADAKIAMYNSATDTLRELDPNNPLLNQLRNPDSVPTPQDIAQVRQAITDARRQNALNFFMPGGNAVGIQGNGDDVRILTGDFSVAKNDFDNLTIGGEPYDASNYDGTMIQLPGNGGLIGLRPSSSYDLPSIDVNIPGVPFRTIRYK